MPFYANPYTQEKKLATFWVIATLKATLDTTDLSRVHELRQVALPEGWREAVIFLDHKPCQNVSRPRSSTRSLLTKPYPG
jgi:hypothetical protein